MPLLPGLSPLDSSLTQVDRRAGLLHAGATRAAAGASGVVETALPLGPALRPGKDTCNACGLDITRFAG